MIDRPAYIPIYIGRKVAGEFLKNFKLFFKVSAFTGKKIKSKTSKLANIELKTYTLGKTAFFEAIWSP